MCNPVAALVAGGAASVAGTAYNNRQQRRYHDAVQDQNVQAFKASEEMRRLEQERQDNMRAERRGTFMDAARAADPGEMRARLDGDQDRNVSEVEALRTLQTPGWLDGAGTGASESGQSGRANRVVSDNAGQLAAQGRLRGAASGWPDVDLALSRAGSDIGFIDQNMRGSAGVADQERNIGPADVYPGNSMLGDLLLAGGSLGLQRAGHGFGKSSIGSGGSSASSAARPPVIGSGALY